MLTMTTDAMSFYENLPEEDEDQLLDEGKPPVVYSHRKGQL